jgi:hypothetical protein
MVVILIKDFLDFIKEVTIQIIVSAIAPIIVPTLKKLKFHFKKIPHFHSGNTSL